jgi:hypothetical protein
MKKLVSALAIALIPAAGLVAAAAPAQAAVTCTSVHQSSDGHTVSVTCSSGAGSQYKFYAEFCSTGGCSLTSAPWKNYGNTATITSGGFFSGKVAFATR